MFRDRLIRMYKDRKSLLCIGLDSDIGKLPGILKTRKYPQFEFNKRIIDATCDLVCAYKPNAAFYESRGIAGIRELKMTCDYLKRTHPDILLILDAKRADIGNTNDGYAKYAFTFLGADAVTLHPYLGKEALKPFLDRKDKGCIILCRTSNPGAGEFQDLPLGKPESPEVPRGDMADVRPLYQAVAERVVRDWNGNGNCMLVVGATYPEELARVREIAGDMTILVPGIGAQGGDIHNTLRAGLDADGNGLIISVSRGIIFASDGGDFARKSRQEAIKLNDAIRSYRFRKGE